MMLYASAKYGHSKRYSIIVVLTLLQILDVEQIKENISYVRVSGHESKTSIKSYARKLSSSRKCAISDTFSRATRALGANSASLPNKTTKNNQAAQPKVFSPKHDSIREQQFQVIPVSPLSTLEN